MRRTIPPSRLCALQQKPDSVRNICILAHVDHGKTTLADSLVASNGVISPRLAGKLRYMDSREDEQIRGITMKSSAIALLYEKGDSEYLVNLVDSPGHVDFSSEVSTAVRACDGAIVLVDAVEGVCPQTHVVLRQAWREGVKPVLVINKIDRLIAELQMTTLEAHLHLQQVLEQVNAVTGSLFATEVMETAEREALDADGTAVSSADNSRGEVYEDWDLDFDKKDEESLYFAPDRGNVVFASAVDGWGFRVSDFADLYSSKLGINVQLLRRTLWGDFYLNTKAKRIMKGAQAKGKKPLFVQFILDNIWAVYDAVNRKDKEKIGKITTAMNLTVAARDLRSTDPKVQLLAICGQWLPLSPAVLSMVVEHLPCPRDMTSARAERLLSGGQRALTSYPARTQALKSDLLACSSSSDAPVVAFVSKMFSVRKADLARSATSVPVPAHTMAVSVEEIAARREQARLMSQRRSAAAAAASATVATAASSTGPAGVPLSQAAPSTFESSSTTSTTILFHTFAGGQDPQAAATSKAQQPEGEDQSVLLAFTRVFSGTLDSKRPLLVLRARHDPSQFADSPPSADDPASYPSEDDDAAVVACQPTQMYLLMGRELIAIDSAPAGCVVGVAGLAGQILRHGTISSTTALPPLAAMEFPTSAVVRVALEPSSAGDTALMMRGLRRLRAADCAVEYCTEASGECVLSTAGEVHLERCLDDLRTVFAPGLGVTCSDPIVPFRETVVPPPDVDMVNETIDKDVAAVAGGNAARQQIGDEDGGGYEDDEATPAEDPTLIIQHTADRGIVLHIRAVPLPSNVSDLLEKNAHRLKALAMLNANQESGGGSIAARLTQAAVEEIQDLKQQLAKLLKSHETLSSVVDSIAAFGPRQVGPNMLVNAVKDYRRPSVWHNLNAGADESNSGSTAAAAAAAAAGSGGAVALRQLDHSVMHGFQLATLAGPLCEEPMHGVCFLLEEWTATDTASATTAAATVATKPPGENGRGSGAIPIPVSPQVQALTSPLLDSSPLAATSHDSSGFLQQMAASADAASGDVQGAALSSYGPSSGQLMSAMKDGCRRAFLAQPPRIMTAMYSCEIHATSEVLGRLYAVFGRRGGRVVYEDLRPGSTNVFGVQALLPVAESFGFAAEIRKKTSGSASPQLFFSHWEVVPGDPFWVPTTEEELLHFGEKADSDNQARLYVNAVRRRKGLAVDEKLVEHAEKQRTMTRT